MNQNQTTLPLPSLFCKTVDGPVFCRHVPLLDANISFRPLHLTSDLDVIFGWVNETYARRFWQLNGSKELLEDTYAALLLSPHTHSFIGLINDQPVAQVDIYQVAA
ncbi:MAG TPA: GNAT family N-acetyltransferase, partial [Agriterribacter sp.]|nr:GNAT family N-acetyltransferase [Agriterribacter sp.]